jgi:hypothetical protein
LYSKGLEEERKLYKVSQDFVYIMGYLNENNTGNHHFLECNVYNNLQVAPRMKELMMRKGSMMISYQPLQNLPNFFRFVVQNSGVTHEDADYFLDELEHLGADL